jgi:hypothetical protein
MLDLTPILTPTARKLRRNGSTNSAQNTAIYTHQCSLEPTFNPLVHVQSQKSLRVLHQKPLVGLALLCDHPRQYVNRSQAVARSLQVAH